MKAIDQNLTFFANGTVVARLQNSDYTTGNRGVSAGRENDTHLTDASYTYAKVWML